MTERAEPAMPVPHNEVRRYFERSGPAPDWTRDIEMLRRETREEALAVRGDLERVAAGDAISIAGVPARLDRPAPPPADDCCPDAAAGNVPGWGDGRGGVAGAPGSH